ncbi:MAG: dUTP diphosphatase [Faecousia sp.]
MEKISVKLLRPGARVPTYGTEASAGADLYACMQDKVEVGPGQSAMIPTGIAMEIPKGYAGLVFARSSMGAKRGLAPANKVGVIDSDYRGEIRVVLHNHSGEPQSIEPGERVAQLLIVPVFTPGFQEAKKLSDTGRGAGGFGSTGK